MPFLHVRNFKANQVANSKFEQIYEICARANYFSGYMCKSVKKLVSAAKRHGDQEIKCKS